MFFLVLCLDTIERWVSFSLHFAPGLYELGMQPRKCRFRLLLDCLILGVYVQLDDVPDGTSKKGIDMSGGLCIPSSGFGTRPAPRMRSPPRLLASSRGFPCMARSSLGRECNFVCPSALSINAQTSDRQVLDVLGELVGGLL